MPPHSQHLLALGEEQRRLSNHSSLREKNAQKCDRKVVKHSWTSPLRLSNQRAFRCTFTLLLRALFYFGMEAKKSAGLFKWTVFSFNWRHSLLISNARMKLQSRKSREASNSDNGLTRGKQTAVIWVGVKEMEADMMAADLMAEV
jgi:hypothetical protein